MPFDDAQFQSTPLREGRPGTMTADAMKPYFNPRPSVRGDGFRFCGIAGSQHFNPRPSVRGDCNVLKRFAVADAFQSTPLREGRLLAHLSLFRRSNFNPRPSVRGDRIEHEAAKAYGTFQSTPLREGRPRAVALVSRALSISIHAPP